MTREAINRMLQVTDEAEARQLTTKWLEDYGSDTEAVELLRDDFRYVFGSSFMPFEHIAMWAQVFVEVTSVSQN